MVTGYTVIMHGVYSELRYYPVVNSMHDFHIFPKVQIRAETLAVFMRVLLVWVVSLSDYHDLWWCGWTLE